MGLGLFNQYECVQLDRGYYHAQFPDLTHHPKNANMKYNFRYNYKKIISPLWLRHDLKIKSSLPKLVSTGSSNSIETRMIQSLKDLAYTVLRSQCYKMQLSVWTVHHCFNFEIRPRSPNLVWMCKLSKVWHWWKCPRKISMLLFKPRHNRRLARQPNTDH